MEKLRNSGALNWPVGQLPVDHCTAAPDDQQACSLDDLETNSVSSRELSGQLAPPAQCPSTLAAKCPRSCNISLGVPLPRAPKVKPKLKLTLRMCITRTY